MSDEVVRYEREGAVATITLNRPERLNAWTYEMEDRYFDLLTAADDDPDVRVIVVTGAGRGFCAGMDSAILDERAQSGSGPYVRTRPMAYPLSVRKPLLAAVNGGCAGIGFLQALLCDVRFAAEEAKLATAFTRRGLAPEFGVTWLLGRLVGTGHASDLLLSARTITGVEAAAMGLVNRALPADELLPTTREYARDLAENCAPRAMAHAKRQLWEDWMRGFAESGTDALELQRRPEHAADFSEGVASFVARRPPVFEALGPRGARY